MPYAEMHEIINLGQRYGYFLCTENGNYFLCTSEPLYTPLCSSRLDVSQISQPYTQVNFFSSEALECVRYYNDLRGNIEWERSGYQVY